jgi:hypothetical protein
LKTSLKLALNNIAKAETQAATAFDTIQLLFGMHATLLRGELNASRALEVGAAIDQYKTKPPNERLERLSIVGTATLEQQIQMTAADKPPATPVSQRLQ